jgi:hypothetical protein
VLHNLCCHCEHWSHCKASCLGRTLLPQFIQTIKTNENNHPVKFICDLLIKGLSYQNKSYLQILMNCLFDVHLIKDDLKKNGISNVYM